VKIKILPSAVEDLNAGRLFYEMQAEGVGDYFFDALFSDIDSLLLFAGVHRKVWGFYRMLSRRFPYAVYYKMDGDLVIVWRVLDLRRDPDGTQRALQQS
jgi:plasmid stabilization system protein ParE